ncbi:MAG: ATP phosphoribosyltransferase regulatory subunit, partial [Candidatus Rokubacteria bacterium]|nr:ATP phosphoribosyltransferase regulatory subunit [Candidatus Rokubacteria bacterium]
MDRRLFQAQLPKGAKIYLPDEAARKRFVEGRLWSVFSQWGYREVVAPSYEYFDVLSLGTDQDLQEKMFKLVDRETGRMLALRADVTPQIARIVATRLRDAPKPLRLAYVTNVFRYDDPQVGRYREFFQAGVELVGLEKPEADAEMISMAVEGLKALGLGRFQIDVGQVEFFRGILEEIRADGAIARTLRDALGRKDASTMERLVSEMAPPVA